MFTVQHMRRLKGAVLKRAAEGWECFFMLGKEEQAFGCDPLRAKASVIYTVFPEMSNWRIHTHSQRQTRAQK